MTAYYNEIDPKAAAWLRELIKQGHIAPGDVDERSISDVKPEDLFKYTQCHFFAGIGVWSYALRKSGWPDDRPVWTGSCPCQPFSSAGKRKGTSDERHLWPHWFHLISQCRPSDVFGEQVASKDGRAWFDTVQADMEALGFAVGAADLCAAGVGAPHIRQRLWFYGRSGASGHIADVKWREYDQPESMADASDDRPQGRLPGWQDTQRQMVNGSLDVTAQLSGWATPTTQDAARGAKDPRPHDKGVPLSQQMALSGWPTPNASNGSGGGQAKRFTNPERSNELNDCVMLTGWATPRASDGTKNVRTTGGRCRKSERKGSTARPTGERSNHTAYPTNGFWRDADWLGCRDGKFRPVEPGTFPLVNGAAARVGRLRGYGNAIVAQVAQTFIEATQGW